MKLIADSEGLLYAELPFVIGIVDGNIWRFIARHFQDILIFTNLTRTAVTLGYERRQIVYAAKSSIIAAGVRFKSGT